MSLPAAHVSFRLEQSPNAGRDKPCPYKFITALFKSMPERVRVLRQSLRRSRCGRACDKCDARED